MPYQTASKTSWLASENTFMELHPKNLDFAQMGETVDIHGTQYVAFSQVVWEQIDRTIRELHATCESETKWAKHYADRCESLESAGQRLYERLHGTGLNPAHEWPSTLANVTGHTPPETLGCPQHARKLNYSLI